MNQCIETITKLYNINLYLLDVFDLRKSYASNLNELNDNEILKFYSSKLFENTSQMLKILDNAIYITDYEQLLNLKNFMIKIFTLQFYHNFPATFELFKKIDNRIKSEDISKYLNPTI
jgi:hypothetical protein